MAEFFAALLVAIMIAVLFYSLEPRPPR